MSKIPEQLSAPVNGNKKQKQKKKKEKAKASQKCFRKSAKNIRALTLAIRRPHKARKAIKIRDSASQETNKIYIYIYRLDIFQRTNDVSIYGVHIEVSLAIN